MPGPPKKPAKVARLHGTYRKDRHSPPAVEFPECGTLPDAPDWLPNADARLEWDRLTRYLAGVGLLTEAGLSPLAHLCAVHGRIAQIYRAGESPSGHLVAQLRGLSRDFGLTPAATLPPVEGKTGNKFRDRDGRKDH